MSGRHAGGAELGDAQQGDVDAVGAPVEAPTPDASPVVVTTGNATPTEVAAITAVISGLLAEEGEARREEEPRGTTAWQRSQRSMRGTLQPGTGRWLG